ncbi:MAG: amidohydrolase [Proteobacteria bacterium]|nr:amidohydrolase [Pseudomonadota bacterium]
MASAIWDNPELGYLETRTAKTLADALTKAGFQVTTGVAGIPTALTATFGSGSPVIGILGEMDALPGKSQASVPVQQEVAGKVNNQGCGHNLFGPGSVAAAIAVKNWLVASHHSGTIRFYGTPAEEGGSGKVYMVRAGLFKDVDAVLHWHPAMVNAAVPITNNAVISAKFRFHGKASHAATSPERGRSALEAVEAMDTMVNMMRQHVRDGARISYIITNGGSAPNVVPDFAEVYYYVRESDVPELRALWQRVLKTAEAAAMGTETRYDYEVIHGAYNLLPNESLDRDMDANLRKRAAAVIRWTPAEQAFAKKIYSTFDKPWLPFGSEADVQPFEARFIPGSSDVGDVSWNVPTGGMVTTTWVPSSDAHTWQATAVGRMGIGFKGMELASEVIAMTAVQLMKDPARVAVAREEFQRRRGADFKYEALVGDRAPPLDYRKNPQAEMVQ